MAKPREFRVDRSGIYHIANELIVGASVETEYSGSCKHYLTTLVIQYIWFGTGAADCVWHQIPLTQGKKK